MAWLNYLVNRKIIKNTEGHLDASDLREKMLANTGEAYHCIFNVRSENLKLDNGKPTFKEYEGEVMPVFGMIHFDFDSDNPSESLSDVRRFLQFLDVPDYFVAFSGSKGFHVSIPAINFGITTGEDLPRNMKALAARFKEHYPTIDTSIYSPNNKHRALNSKHPKTGLYKTLVKEDWDIDIILSTAKSRGESFYTNIAASAQPLLRLVDLYKQSKIEVEYNKDNAGSAEAPTDIEAFDNKLCIKALLKREPEVGDRNTTALVIINDMFKTGRDQEKTTEIMRDWAAKYMPVDRQAEVDNIVNDIYNRVRYYNHGCQDPIKAARCSKKCKLYNKVKFEKRPIAEDLTDNQKVKLEEKKADAKKPKEQAAVHSLLTKSFGCVYDGSIESYTNGNLLKQEKDLFYYKDGYWQILETRETDILRRKLYKTFGANARSNQVESAFKTFLAYAPSKPKRVDLFTPNPKVTNFINGSLHLIDNEGEYSLDFREHDKHDYITHIIDLEYSEDLTEVNTDFEEMLLRIFEEDDDKLEKIACLSELFGAALMPAFPHLFFLYGVPQSGKSVICKILMNLIGRDNISNVPPHEFNGFNMESMLHKLVNLVTDIDTRPVISDAMVKQIEDREPALIRRKNKKDLRAAMPAVHIFGANDLPKTFDGSNKAHDRRWTIVKFNKPYTGKMYRDIDKLVFNKSPRGVLNFALRGLQRLIESGGFFSESSSGKAEKDAWQLENDNVGLFLKDIEEGEVVNAAGNSLEIKEGLSIYRADLWDAFRKWLLDTNKGSSKIGRTKFYKLVESKGYPLRRSKDGYYFDSIGV